MRAGFSISPELLAAAQSGKHSAQNEIILQLTPLLQRLTGRYFIIGADKEDLLQEARIGLHNAIQSYDPAKGADFLAYARTCIHNNIISAIKEAHGLKHAPLNKSVELHSTPLFSYDSPMDLVIIRETLESILAIAEHQLSKLEKQVLFLYLDGLTYREISHLLHCSEKSVSNALCRIRSKLS